MGKASDAEIRISDAEREEAVSTLGEHLSTGRLELSEFEERCERAATARTRGELEELFGDLPAPHPDLSSATPPVALIQKAGQLVTGGQKSKQLVETGSSKALEAVAGLTFFFGIPGAILLTIFQGAWWTFIPVVFVVIVAGGCADAIKKNATEGGAG
jgi:Domain of unknown function (DUF1707)